MVDFFNLIDSCIGGSRWFIFLLLGTGLFFTIYLRFPQIRYFKHSLKVLFGKYDDKNSAGETSHFQALTAALSGTVGTGNIAGVAFAIHLGGPGALFWMLITALVGMATKYVEVTLSFKYREKVADGSMAGGPMYYMKNKLNMKWLALIFTIATLFSALNLPQINSIANTFQNTFGAEKWVVGLVLSIVLFVIIEGGIKRIVKITEKVVPIMGGLYFIGGIAIILYNYENIIPSFLSVFTSAFSGTAATGGFLGASVVYAFNRGVNRGLFSNEAGQGSSAIAHASAKADHPASEGVVSLIEPFVDTIIICFITGMILLTSGVWCEKFDNSFHFSDIIVLNKEYDENTEADKQILYSVIDSRPDSLLYTGVLTINDGKIDNDLTMIHSRSVAENVVVNYNKEPFNGEINVVKGTINPMQFGSNSVIIEGKSLVHSAPLTALAFRNSFLGRFGEFIIPISLLLFAFTTSIAWSYYGDRSVTYLFGPKSIRIYHVIYCLIFFVASFTDTTIIWAFAGIYTAVMAIPNLIGIILLCKDMKQTDKEYYNKQKELGRLK